MKKIFKRLMLMLIAIAILSTSALAFQRTNLYTVDKYTCNVRPAVCIVTAIKDETISLTDDSGNVWQVTGYDDLLIGDYVAVTFSDNGTQEIKDDTIIALRYQRVDKLENFVEKN